MLSQVRRVGPLGALVVVAMMAGLSYFALASIAGSGDGANRPVVRVAAAPKPPTRITGTVGGVKVVDGKLLYSGAIKAPKKRRPTPAAPAPAAAPAVTSSSSSSAGSSLALEVGQLVISPVAGLRADAALLHRVRAGQVGGVILFADNIATVGQVKQLVDALQGAAAAGGNPGLLVMTDQEGGDVKRFRSAPPTMSAQAMGAGGSSLAEGATTGAALAQRGVNVDLAPVADVPVSSTNFLGTRAFARTPAEVSRSACQFSAGLHQGGVASSLKHFPGLGKTSGNTDNRIVRIQAGRRELASDLQPYRKCANQPRTMVMVSNAAYSGLTGSQPAVISPSTYELLRADLGFSGPTISDSLNAAAVASVPQLAVEAASAGLDLQLWTSVAGAQHAYDELLSAATSGGLTRSRLHAAAARVQLLKQSLRLV